MTWDALGIERVKKWNLCESRKRGKANSFLFLACSNVFCVDMMGIVLHAFYFCVLLFFYYLLSDKFAFVSSEWCLGVFNTGSTNGWMDGWMGASSYDTVFDFFFLDYHE